MLSASHNKKTYLNLINDKKIEYKPIGLNMLIIHTIWHQAFVYKSSRVILQRKFSDVTKLELSSWMDTFRL